MSIAIPPAGGNTVASDRDKTSALTVGVVIPALNEEVCIEQTVRACLRSATPLRVIVVDGGSVDQTIARAEAGGARALRASRGKAIQMNAGAAECGADVLLFLHADTTPPPDFDDAIRRAFLEPDVVGGAFSLRIDDPSWLMRLVAKLSTLRARLLSLPYGDQGLFVRREIFERIGGFHELPLLEDTEICGRLRGAGRLRILPEAVTTSVRRWRSEGPLTVITRHWFIGLAYACGASPAWLARWSGPPIR